MGSPHGGAVVFIPVARGMRSEGRLFAKPLREAGLLQLVAIIAVYCFDLAAQFHDFSHKSLQFFRLHVRIRGKSTELHTLLRELLAKGSKSCTALITEFLELGHLLSRDMRSGRSRALTAFHGTRAVELAGGLGATGTSKSRDGSDESGTEYRERKTFYGHSEPLQNVVTE